VPEDTCSIEGCSDPSRSRGWCRGHYMRWRRYGDPVGKPSGPRLSEDSAAFWGAVENSGALDQPPVADLEDDAFGHWLAGIIDGEGCFLIGTRQDRGYFTRFQMLLRADDVAVLNAARQRTGLGALYYSKRGKGDPKGGQPGVQWVIYRRADCEALVTLLDRYPLLTKKARDYKIWREAVAIMETKLTGGRIQPWDDMAALKQRLESIRAYVAPTGGLF
jgi:hypothetical protein